MQEAIEKLRAELKTFYNSGLTALLEDLLAGATDVRRLPARGTWKGCPLSYRLGSRGSVDRDSEGWCSNAFTDAWDGIEQDYLDEKEVISAVRAEIERRRQKRLRSAEKVSRRKAKLSKAKTDTGVGA